MNRLEQQFGDEIEFVLVDWDDKSLNDFRLQYGITGRTQYVLIDEQGNVVNRWFGPLNEDLVESELQAFVDSLNSG